MIFEGLVIFDCDGVLVDSEPIASRVFSDALSSLGLRTTAEEVDRKYRGRSLSDCLALVEVELGRSLPEDFHEMLVVETRRAFASDLKPIIGVADVLARLKEQGQRRCVASSGSPDKIRHSLTITHLLQYFEPEDCLFSASSVARGKPHPDLFLHAARHMGVSVENCVVVEDSRAGVTAARSANMRVFGYVGPDSPEGQEEALGDLGATVFRDMSQLPELLLNMALPRSR